MIRHEPPEGVMASRKKPNNAGRKKDGIHFVNARPTSETERLKAQRLVRAHVGRWISDQTKDRSSAASDSSTPNAVRAASHPSHVRDSISPPLPAPSDHAPGPSSYPLVSPSSLCPTTRAHGVTPGFAPAFDDRPHREWQGSPFPPSHHSDSSDSSDDCSTVTVLSSEPAAVIPWSEPSRFEPQISGSFDPFCTYPSNFSPEVVNVCESYC